MDPETFSAHQESHTIQEDTRGCLFREIGRYCLPVCLYGSLNYDWLTQNTEFWLASQLRALKNVPNCLLNYDWGFFLGVNSSCMPVCLSFIVRHSG